MAVEYQTGFRTFANHSASVAIPAYRRVKVESTGRISLAGVGENAVGITTEVIPANGSGTVKLINARGTFLIEANTAISLGATVVPTADGRIGPGTVNTIGWLALKAAAGAGDVIECALVLRSA